MCTETKYSPGTIAFILTVSKFLSTSCSTPFITKVSLLSPRSSLSRIINAPSFCGNPTIVLFGPSIQISKSIPEVSNHDIVIKNSARGLTTPSSATGLINKNAIKSKLVNPIRRLNNRSINAMFELYPLI